MEFCQHRQSASKKEKDKTSFKLVVPISIFISKCEVMWESLVREIQCDDGELSIGQGVPCEGVPSTPIIRRILSSDILGCILVGSIKTTSSGKLQLFDATGSVDIVVPDIFPSFLCQGIHEVKEFKIVLEGPFVKVESSELHSSEPLSCKSIFGELPEKNLTNHLAVYVHFYFKDSTCLNAPINFPLCMVNNFSTSRIGIAHLLLVSHKFPAAETYAVDANASNSISLFAEALLLPYDANFVDEDGHNHVRPAYELNNPETKYCRRSKVVESRWHSYSSSNCDLSPSGTRPGFPCLLTFPKSSPQVHVTGNLCRKGGSVLENKSAGLHPILLEFLSDSFIKYQSLLVGGYYIMMCSKECAFCFQKDSMKRICAKVILSSKTILWNVSFSFDMGQPKKVQPRYQNSQEDSVGAYQICSENVCQNDLVFKQLHTQLNDFSDAHLLISPDKPGSINQIEALKEEISSHFSMLQGVTTVSSFIQIIKSDISRSLKCAGSQHGSFFNTELVSVCGNIESLHLFNCKFGSFISKESAAFDCKRESSICLHVYDDQNMIHIRGKLLRSYPVGLGPGVNATFHRVLVKCYPGGFPKLVLTSVSHIVINSVKETSFLCRNRAAPLSQFDRNSEHTLNSVPLNLISQFNDLLDIKLARLLCRVVTIHFLVLERLELDCRGLGSRIGPKMPSIMIRLAGFLLDDGSSLCCCWADGKRAETLLRLDEISCQPFFHCGVASARKTVGCHDTVGFQLDKLLKKHHKVIMKNYRAAQDVSSMDFMFYCNSGEIFSNAEESLLRFVISNACQGSAFNLAGHLMDSTTLGSLPKECEDMQDVVRPLTNIWAAEIEHINSLKQARDLFDDLSTG
ncbi:CST complex subunit CTC1 [Platanthera zijinensis]|uniref:CST complex subunit CTC1 n=1 Tax=Platanthera zijinensis TaxID=2320716 RepID=A0AAP0GES1_9ASPA